ncbi:oligosaccharide flippase family protein [Xylanibacter muris]|uniref:Lipopolysaccharide biosynthesis protein n=1 Tax=Xylanibacter muris TaxID=2736290 RepID=A0ABX2AKR9_9BACT|nr:lipopolysaccharide biosynthesis protein [Xylanibacter muris]NPD90760.1 lipopolysaccharide biosynthesis protein [Xylanibacter muris]
MASLKSLAKDTAIYGLSSIIGRFLNYLLVPLYTAKFAASEGGYGVITNIYAYVALLMVILTYGMETTFFRFSNKEHENPQTVYTTILTTIGCTSLIFFIAVLAFITPISQAMGYGDHPSYIWVMAATVALDAFQCIPFSWLRQNRRPIKFAALKLLFIIMNIVLNLTFFLLLPALYEKYPETISAVYDPTVGVGYAFYINLACTATITLFFRKELTGFRYVFDSRMLRRMLSYSWPILVLGIAGILNQTADKILFPYIYKAQDANEQLGIYGAASKIAMIMAMITQAFRYAYEPFVFGKSADKDNRATYAKAMKYFVIFTLMAFLTVIGYMEILKHIIGADYREGLKAVPIVMAAEIMMGIYFNLSFWYKLIDKTIWGAWFSGAGCAVLIITNVVFVPRYGYMACAWAGFAGYATAMTLSYFAGQKYYPINYPLKDMAGYIVLAGILFACMQWSNSNLPVYAKLALNTLLIGTFAAYLIRKDFPLSSLPVIGRKLGKR